jgi:predicted dehydrogenase
MRPELSRRTFAAGLAAGGGFFALHGFGAEKPEGPSDRLSIAVVGIGGQGAANLGGVKSQAIVALCDVDERRAAKGFEQFPDARRFGDFRRMFDAMEKQIDAVVVSTPDHTHFHPAWWALERGKHLYLEKPLAHEVEEVRRLTEAARARGLATQLGCQRHAMPTLRNGVEIVRAGLIGEVCTVHSWVASGRGMPALPPGPEPVPAGLDWDLWLGPVAARPYTKGFAPYDWRFWWEFGTGETGNWGCHILDIPFWALELSHPVRIEATGPEADPDRTPKSLASRLDFPERTAASGRSLPAVSVHWHQGRPPVLDELGIDARAEALSTTGPVDASGKKPKKPTDDCNTLFIGSEGMLLCGFGRHFLLPTAADREATVPRSLPPSPGFHKEWLAACRGGEPASCRFDYAGPLAESVLLANIAYRLGAGFDWKADSLTADRVVSTRGESIGPADVAARLRRAYREGWEV